MAWQDESRLWAAGEVHLGWTTEGILLHSIDGGDHWFTVIGNYPNTLAGVFFHDADHGWVGGTAAELLRTTDGGDTWSPVDTLGAPTYTLDFTSSSVGHSAGIRTELHPLSDHRCGYVVVARRMRAHGAPSSGSLFRRRTKGSSPM